MDAYFELAQGSSVRLCRKLEKQFSDLRGWQLELMNYLCFVAYNSEIYDGVCEDAWLRTTITVEENPSPILSEVSLERNLMARNHSRLSSSSVLENAARVTLRPHCQDQDSQQYSAT